MEITFCGAAKQVTGSCHLVHSEHKRVLVDCGMIQGEKFSEEANMAPFPFEPSSIDAVLITHAHIDHCGRLPKLVKEGFHGPIISTAATLDFVALMLEDSAHVIEHEAELHKKVPLYTAEDVAEVVKLFQPTEYSTPVEVGDITATFHDAGHILGSSFIELRTKDSSVVFSGDLGNYPVPLLRETAPLPVVDAVVMESTYGNRVHEDVDTRKQLLNEALIGTLQNGGTVLIPAFSLERTQEILYEFNALQESGELPAVPVFVDSPLGIKATKLYPVYNRLFDAEAHQRIKSGDDLFQFPGMQMTPTVAESKKINEHKEPKIIIAGSGMMQGGRIRHHLKRYLPMADTTVLIIGYQADRTLGRQLLQGDKEVKIDNEYIPVKAKVKAIGGYSAHADQPRLLAWLKSAEQLPKHVFLVHGEPEAMDELSAKIIGELHIPCEAGELGKSVWTNR